MTDSHLFNRRTLVALVLVGLFSLGLSAVLALDGPRPPSEAPVPSTASRAATGHRAFLTFLRELGYSVRMTGAGSTLLPAVLVLEPDLDPARPETGARLGDVAGGGPYPVLVVLPKWVGQGDANHPGWLERVDAIPAANVAFGLEAIGVNGTVVRRDGPVPLHSLLPGGGDADIEHPQLLVNTPDLQPLVSGPDGILVGQLVDKDEDDDEGRLIIVVSDPDLLSNQGLHRGSNAAIAAALVARLTSGKPSIVIDESLLPHGHRSLFTGLLRFPTLFAVLQLLLCLGLLVWAGAVRFGAPVPPPDVGPRGTSALVEGAVALQLLVGSPKVALDSLIEGTVREVSDRLHAPAALKGLALDRWLESRAAAFGAPGTLAGLRWRAGSALAAKDILAAAQAVQHWRRRMLDGTR